MKYLTLLLWLLAACCYAQNEAELEPTTLTNREVAARSIHWQNVGNTSTTPPGFRVGKGITTLGWDQFVAKCGEVVEQTKCRGVWIHNPFGDAGTWPMRFDQRSLLLEAIRTETNPTVKQQLERLERGFYPAWRKYLKGDYTPSNTKPHVWFYLGTALHNPTLDSIADKPAAWTWRWRQATYPILLLAEEFPGQVHLAVDRHLDLPEEHPQYGGLRMLESLGIEIIVEPRPLRTHKHLHRFGTVQLMREGGWDRSNPFPKPREDGTIPWTTDGATNEEIQGVFYAMISRSDRDNLDAARRVLTEYPERVPVQPLDRVLGLLEDEE